MNAGHPSGTDGGPFVLHAPNVHVGGGKSLLLTLLAALTAPAVVLLDTRLAPLPDLPDGITVLRFPPTLLGRLRAERALARHARTASAVLCFGNLPPALDTPRGKVSVFLQNRYLLPGAALSGLPLRTRLRLAVERAWLRHRLGDCRLIVQSQTMADAALAAFGRPAAIHPFAATATEPAGPAGAAQQVDFLYVASGEAHKNHATLLQAWAHMAAEGLTPSLGLTLGAGDRARLDANLRRAALAGADIRMFDPRPPAEMGALMSSARAAIYPSLFESFGLPLIEAARAGLPILASERDYVRDVVDPVETFDPTSSRSIARAVRRFLDAPPQPRPPILDAQRFLATVRGGP